MKYELVKDDTKEWDGHTLYRIRALRSFSDVKRGDLGGWVESEDNLSQEGDCWVYGDARVCGNARVYDSAWISSNAWIYGDAKVYGNAWVSGDAEVYGDAIISDRAWVFGKAMVYGNAWISGDAKVYGNAWVSGNAEVYGEARLSMTKSYIDGKYVYATDGSDVSGSIQVIEQDKDPNFNKYDDYARLIAVNPVIEDIETKPNDNSQDEIDRLKDELRAIVEKLERLEKK